MLNIEEQYKKRGIPNLMKAMGYKNKMEVPRLVKVVINCGFGGKVAENINIKKKRKRGRKEGEKGQTVEISAPFFASKAKIICPKCGKLTRIGYKIKSGKESGREKTRVCKKCEKEI